MAYPPPPGLNQSSNTTNSLPPRPPPSANPNSFSTPNQTNINNTKSSFTAFKAFAPRSVATAQQSYKPESPIVAAPAQSSYNNEKYQQNSYYGTSTGGYDAQYQETTAGTAPQIKNPFVATDMAAMIGNRGFGNVDPEMEAQIAQWQSAYVSRDEKRVFPTTVGTGLVGKDALTASEMSSAANARSDVASVVTGADGKQKTVIRKGGGETWQDPSLLEWDPAHFRLFVGNLAGEVTDESLLKAFAKYDSVQKARVIRDKRTTKSKGFGFVSFFDGDEYFKAAKEMQGKYIGSHPILLRKSTTEIKAVTPRDQRKVGRHGKGGGHGYDDRTGAGVQKKQSKTKGGLKILG